MNQTTAKRIGIRILSSYKYFCLSEKYLKCACMRDLAGRTPLLGGRRSNIECLQFSRHDTNNNRKCCSELNAKPRRILRSHYFHPVTSWSESRCYLHCLPALSSFYIYPFSCTFHPIPRSERQEEQRQPFPRTHFFLILRIINKIKTNEDSSRGRPSVAHFSTNVAVQFICFYEDRL